MDTAAPYRFVEDPLPGGFLGVLCLGAVDAVSALFDCLASENETSAADVRQAAIFTLRRWIGRGADQDRKLYDREKRTGMLVNEKKYRQIEAETLLDLLHDFSEEATKKPENVCVFDRFAGGTQKLAIRELAAWHLVRLVPWVKVNYNSASDASQRQTAYEPVEEAHPRRAAAATAAATPCPK